MDPLNIINIAPPVSDIGCIPTNTPIEQHNVLLLLEFHKFQISILWLNISFRLLLSTIYIPTLKHSRINSNRNFAFKTYANANLYIFLVIARELVIRLVKSERTNISMN